MAAFEMNNPLTFVVAVQSDNRLVHVPDSAQRIARLDGSV
jgi:hypothetical protein